MSDSSPPYDDPPPPYELTIAGREYLARIRNSPRRRRVRKPRTRRVNAIAWAMKKKLAEKEAALARELTGQEEVALARKLAEQEAASDASFARYEEMMREANRATSTQY